MYGRERKRVLHHRFHLAWVVGKTAARAAQSERRAQDNGVSDFFCGRKPFIDAIGYLGWNNGFADFLTQLFKKLSVLGAFDALCVRTQKLDFTFFQNAFFGELHSNVEARLTADTRDNRVRAFKTTDSCRIFEGQRFHIYLVGNRRVGHNCCRVGI